MWVIEANNEKRQFLVVEPSFYDDLDPCDHFTMKCLEVLRRKLPTHFTQFPAGTQYGIIRYGDFMGNSYPAIGIQCKSTDDYQKIPGFIDLYDEVEKLIDRVGMDHIMQEAASVEVLKWARLKEVGWYFDENISNSDC